jgi:hypothetical protein
VQSAKRECLSRMIVFGRIGRPVVVKDIGNQPVTKQQGRQAARR